MKSLLGTLFNQTPVSFAPSVRNQSINLMGGTKASSRKDQLETMGCVSTVFSIVNRTSNATAAVHWHLYQKAASGKVEDRTEVGFKTLALDLWNKPNEFYTQQEFVEAFQQHVDLTGEGYWVIEYGSIGRIPISMWAVRPDRIAPVKSSTEFLTGWIYKDPDGDDIPLGRDEVIQLRMPNPLDPYRGMGPVQTVLNEIASSEAATAYNANFFRNSAEPGGIIQVPDRLSDTEFDELRARWNEQHRGVSRAHRVAILEHGTYQPLGYTHKDMQFVDLKNMSREVIREAFGIPKFAVGDLNDVNRATADASKAWFAEQLTVPRLERIKGALNNDFLPLFGTATVGFEFDYESPVPADADAENAALTTKVNAFKVLVDAQVDPISASEIVGLPVMNMREVVTQ